MLLRGLSYIALWGSTAVFDNGHKALCPLSFAGANHSSPPNHYDSRDSGALHYLGPNRMLAGLNRVSRLECIRISIILNISVLTGHI